MLTQVAGKSSYSYGCRWSIVSAAGWECTVAPQTVEQQDKHDDILFSLA